MNLTVCIKAFNEEDHISDAITSALNAVRNIEAEIIVADCCSTDRTVEIAKSFPVRVALLSDPTKRSCGVGAQLGFQYAQGDYVYVMDGDMLLDETFIGFAISYLENHPEVAGVGGTVVEERVANMEFQLRQAGMARAAHRREGFVDRLDGGGLYRRQAIIDAGGGYYADQNLHGFEEFELGVRLQANGWKLARLDRVSARHFGHTVKSWPLLWSRLTSKYAYGTGEVMRAAIENGLFRYTIRRFGRALQSSVVIIWWWSIFVSIVMHAFIPVIVFLIVPFILLVIRRKSWSNGLYSFASWNVFAVGFVLGFLQSRRPPRGTIPSELIGGNVAT